MIRGYHHFRKSPYPGVDRKVGSGWTEVWYLSWNFGVIKTGMVQHWKKNARVNPVVLLALICFYKNKVGMFMYFPIATSAISLFALTSLHLKEKQPTMAPNPSPPAAHWRRDLMPWRVSPSTKNKRGVPTDWSTPCIYPGSPRPNKVAGL